MMRCCYYIILMNVNPTWYCPITSDFLKLIFNHFTFEHRSNTVPTRQNLWERRPNSGFVFVTVQALIWVCYGGPRTGLKQISGWPREDPEQTWILLKMTKCLYMCSWNTQKMGLQTVRKKGLLNTSVRSADPKSRPQADPGPEQTQSRRKVSF